MTTKPNDENIGRMAENRAKHDAIKFAKELYEYITLALGAEVAVQCENTILKQFEKFYSAASPDPENVEKLKIATALLDAERAKLAIAVEALRFYADPCGEADLVDDNDYETNPAYPKESPIPVPGIRARAALKKIEGEK